MSCLRYAGVKVWAEVWPAGINVGLGRVEVVCKALGLDETKGESTDRVG